MCSLMYIRRMYSLVNDTFKPYTNQKKKLSYRNDGDAKNSSAPSFLYIIFRVNIFKTSLFFKYLVHH